MDYYVEEDQLDLGLRRVPEQYLFPPFFRKGGPTMSLCAKEIRQAVSHGWAYGCKALLAVDT
jgi:hypothetical protein